jgi:hypothetical protein
MFESYEVNMKLAHKGENEKSYLYNRDLKCTTYVLVCVCVCVCACVCVYIYTHTIKESSIDQIENDKIGVESSTYGGRGEV